jgi:hypothetical protein
MRASRRSLLSRSHPRVHASCVTRRATSTPRHGVVLLEALVAITILTIAGASAVVLATQATEAVRRAREADTESLAGSAFLDAVALWPREDLDRRLGDRRQGPWILRIDHRWPELYVLSLRDSLHSRELLRTSLFRPEPTRASP